MSTTEQPFEANQPDLQAPAEPTSLSMVGENSTTTPPRAATPEATKNARTPAQAAAWAKAEAATPNVARRSATTNDRTLQIIVGAFIAVAALITFFSMAPDEAYEDSRSSIEATDDANNARTEGAPQQAVVNGWTTIEYLNLMSTQQEQSDNRRDALLLIALLGGGAVVATSRISRD